MGSELSPSHKDIDATSRAYALADRAKASWSSYTVMRPCTSMRSTVARASTCFAVSSSDAGISLVPGDATLAQLPRDERAAVGAVESSRRLHEEVKRRIRQRNPSLGANLSYLQVVTLMNGLSERLAKGMTFATWQEAMAFVRGRDHCDTERQ